MALPRIARPSLPLAALLAPLLLGGCISTAKTIVTAPVKVAGKTVDVMTTSQSEADRNRGRAMRKNDEKLRKLSKTYDRDMQRCNHGDRDACDAARAEYDEMNRLRGGY